MCDRRSLILVQPLRQRIEVRKDHVQLLAVVLLGLGVLALLGIGRFHRVLDLFCTIFFFRSHTNFPLWVNYRSLSTPGEPSRVQTPRAVKQAWSSSIGGGSTSKVLPSTAILAPLLGSKVTAGEVSSYWPVTRISFAPASRMRAIAHSSLPRTYPSTVTPTQRAANSAEVSTPIFG